MNPRLTRGEYSQLAGQTFQCGTVAQKCLGPFQWNNSVDCKSTRWGLRNSVIGLESRAENLSTSPPFPAPTLPGRIWIPHIFDLLSSCTPNASFVLVDKDAVFGIIQL